MKSIHNFKIFFGFPWKRFLKIFIVLALWRFFSHSCWRNFHFHFIILLRCRRSYNHIGLSCRFLCNSAILDHVRMWCVNVAGLLSIRYSDGWFFLVRPRVTANSHQIIVLDNTVVRFWWLLVHSVIWGKETKHVE